jgi:hypothetical protein
MKKNYDIRLNPKPLTSEQIARYKDFDSLLNSFTAQPKQRPIVRRLTMAVTAIAASLIGFIFLFNYFTKDDYAQKQAAFFNSRPYISQPFEQVKPTFTSFSVNPNEGGVFKYPSGSQLTVPAAAFVNDKGETLNGEVTLHYREMHDFVDFFVAGIPMTYDSAGVNYNLESAGMIEIFAEQNGKRVNMAPGKAINVELISNVNTSPNSLTIPPGYNIYKLDPANRKWAYQDIDRMEVISDAPAPVANLDEKSPFYPAQKTLAERMLAIQVSEAAVISKLEKTIAKPKEPVKPQRAASNDHVFNLDMDDVFPVKKDVVLTEEEKELRQLYSKYAKMLWQLSPQSSIGPDQLQKEFGLVTGLNIKKLNERDYELTLEKKGESIKVVVNPVLSGSDYDRALAEFNKEFETFQKLNAEREAKLAAQKAAIAKQYEEEKRLATLNFEQRVEELRKQGHDYAANNEIIKKKVVNRFTASEFGVWNCDRPLPPEMLQLAASFVDQNGKPLTNLTAYLVDKSRNTVYQFLAENGAQLRFNKNTENLLWLVTEDNKIAVFRPDQFKAIDPKEKKFDFVLESVDKEIRTEQDIREILYL